MVKNWREAGARQPLAKSLGDRPGGDILFGSTEGLRDTVMLRRPDIQPNPHQPRRIFNEGELWALARSMEQVGQLVPLLVKPDPKEPKRYIIVAGERRWRAADLVGIGRLMAHILPPDTNHDQIALIENLQRVDLSPVEEAEGIKRLVDTHGYSQETVGDLLGRSRTEINTTLTLLRLSSNIREECVQQHAPVSKAVLLELARMETHEQAVLWPLVKAGKMTAREARDHRTRIAEQNAAEDRALARQAAADERENRERLQGKPLPSPRRFLNALPKLEKGLEDGIKSVSKAPKLPAKDRERLRELRRRLDYYGQTLDRILEGP
ncbi:MAG: hypothetical protein RLY86_3830 [Pseudomonadota bacterium]|jgi:ParB family chromosome partitioning protein